MNTPKIGQIVLVDYAGTVLPAVVASVQTDAAEDEPAEIHVNFLSGPFGQMNAARFWPTAAAAADDDDPADQNPDVVVAYPTGL